MSKFKNVLLVEDDHITIMVCERIITMTSFASKIKSVVNGEEAIDYFKSIIGQDEEIPEIIFLDINMPIMNGWEFLNEFEKLKPSLPFSPRIFILSSTVDPEDYKKAEMFASVEEFISKPLTKQHLEKINPS